VAKEIVTASWSQAHFDFSVKTQRPKPTADLRGWSRIQKPKTHHWFTQIPLIKPTQLFL